jgi:hypothetical protein
MFPEWKGDLLVGSLKFALLSRLDRDESGKILGEERMLEGAFGRIRDVNVAPDGSIWLLTDEELRLDHPPDAGRVTGKPGTVSPPTAALSISPPWRRRRSAPVRRVFGLQPLPQRFSISDELLARLVGLAKRCR